MTEAAIAKARKEWQDEHPSDFAEQLAAARKEWLKNHNEDLEKRLSNTIEEVRRIWDEEQKEKTKEVTVEIIVGQSFKNVQEKKKSIETSRGVVCNSECFVCDVKSSVDPLHYFLSVSTQEIDKVRAEMEKAYKESRGHHINQAVELALSHAHADWLKNDEMRQREIDQAVEVATTNAVAEAKEEWEREIKSQVCIKARTSSVVNNIFSLSS